LVGNGSDSFVKPILVSSDGYTVEVKTLVDTGADLYSVIDEAIAIKLCRRFNIATIPLNQQGAVTSYNGEGTTPLTHAMYLDLIIDKRILRKVPFLILDTNQRHDMILGRMWMAENDVLPDCRRRILHWPSEPTLLDEVASTMGMPLPRDALDKPQIERSHQGAAARRDRKFEREDQKLETGGRYRAPRILKQDQRDAYAKMERSFKAALTDPIPPKKTKTKTDPRKLLQIDIACIGGVGFHRIAKKEKTKVFEVSIAQIESILDEKRNPTPELTRDEEMDNLRKTLPPEYHDLIEVFVKSNSDELPPYREGFDAKIDLTETNSIGYGPLYKMSTEELEAVHAYILENLDKGFIEPSKAPFASPILMAEKPGGGLRLCVDYRKLNALTRKDRYPIPLIDEVLERVSKAKFFTKLDIRQGFHRLRMDPDSEELTSFRSRYGSYKYKVLPFGLTNGPAIFQRYMNHVLIDCLDKFATAFVDDILIYSDNLADHREHVRMVLERLKAAGLQAAIHKCEFHVTRTKYLGFIVSTDGVEADPEKVAAITKWKSPTTVKGVQSFLGFCNFYRRFIQGYSRIARVLHHLTRKEVPFIWTPKCEEAFNRLKKALSSAEVLRHYDPDLPTKVETDASLGVISGVLLQLHDSTWHPVAYFSKTMNSAECNYDIHDKEMLAIVRSLMEWRAELEGLQREERFMIYTDHRALEYFMTKRVLNRRQANWSEFISRFHFVIKYRPGKENTLADVLSRPEDMPDNKDSRTQILLRPEWLEEGVQPLPSVEVAAIAQPIEIIDRILKDNRDSQSLESYRELARQGSEDWTVDDDGRLLFQDRLAVANEGDTIARLIDEIHRQPSTAHPGKGKTQALVKARYYWSSWKQDISDYIDNCLICRRSKHNRELPPGLLQPLPIPERPWQHVCVDFKSFPESVSGLDAAFVAVCRLSKRGFAIPCKKTITAAEMARLYVTYIYPWVGLPDSVVSDRGGQFISEFWTEFCKLLGIEIVLTSGQHPEANGQVEVMNQWISQRLRPFISYYQDDWDEYLPMLNLASACLQHESTGLSPFMVERGYEPRMSMDWKVPKPSREKRSLNRQEAQQVVKRIHEAWNYARGQMSHAQEKMKRFADRKRKEASFEVDDEVMVTTKDWDTGRPSRKLTDPWAGPYRIIAKEGHSYRIALPDHIRVHPVFSPDKLRRGPKAKPLEGQIADPQQALMVDGEEEWEIEEMLASRTHYGKLQYRVRYVGYDPDGKWYPASDFINAPVKLFEFHQKYPLKPGPPKNLQKWIDAANRDEFWKRTDDDELPMQKERVKLLKRAK
jgi:transposase InsO family protein